MLFTFFNHFVTIFHKACKLNKLLSMEKSCLEEIGSQPKYNTVYIAATGTPLNCRLANYIFAEQNYLLHNCKKLVPVIVKGASFTALVMNVNDCKSSAMYVRSLPHQFIFITTLHFCLCFSGYVLHTLRDFFVCQHHSQRLLWNTGR